MQSITITELRSELSYFLSTLKSSEDKILVCYKKKPLAWLTVAGKIPEGSKVVQVGLTEFRRPKLLPHLDGMRSGEVGAIFLTRKDGVNVALIRV